VAQPFNPLDFDKPYNIYTLVLLVTIQVITGKRYIKKPFRESNLAYQIFIVISSFYGFGLVTFDRAAAVIGV
jgi:hypothetical protein